MKTALRLGSALGLGLTIVLSFLVFAGRMAIGTHYGLMAAGMFLWFSRRRSG
jgi:hypothetical protein